MDSTPGRLGTTAAHLLAGAIGTVLYYLETGIRAIATFAGGVPVFALLILVLAVGLGWGGGYDLVATERPDATDAAADFEEAPAVRDDLFRAANREGGDGEPATYRLPLRGTASRSGGTTASPVPPASSTPTASGVRTSTRTPARRQDRSSPNTTGRTIG